MLKSITLAAGVAGLLATTAAAQTTTTTTAVTTGAAAATSATATADLNIRAEPSEFAEVIGVIPANASVSVEACAETVNWCLVNHAGTEGWAYGEYLVTEAAGAEPTVIYRYPEVHRIETRDTTAASAAGGGTVGAVVGGLVGGPVGAVAGAALGAAGGAATDPGPQVTSYVVENPVEQVYVDGEVVVGAGLPEAVTLYPVPESELRYVYVNGVPVLVNEERRIVSILR